MGTDYVEILVKILGREPQGWLTPPIQSLKLSGGKQSSCSSCCSFEAWVPSLLTVLFVCTMEAWMQQILFKERGTAAAANSALMSLTGPLPAPQHGRHFDVWRCEGRALSPHGLQLILSGSRAGVHLRARQGTFLWQFSCSYARWGCSGVPAHLPAQVPQQDPPCASGGAEVGKRTWSPQGKNGAQSYCGCVWHTWKGKTPRKRGRNKKRDIKVE